MEIRDIKQRLSIQTVLNHYNLYPDRNGMLKCPFHKDDTASMKIYPQTNTYNCFGCHRNGDAIEFCTEKEGSKHEGLIKAAELCGLQPENPKTRKFQVEKLPAENYKETLTKSFESFKNGLHSPISKRAKEYINLRGLDISKLEMGYNSAAIPKAILEKTDAILQQHL